MAHHCHATGCERTVRPEHFMCYPHWRIVPNGMKALIWATYRRGQCDDQSPSVEYCQAARQAVIFVANKDEIEPDTLLYDLFETRANAVAEAV